MEGLQIESAEVPMDKDGNAAVAVPEGFTPPAAPQATAFTGQPGNLMSDLAALAAEQQPAPVTPPQQEPPQEPEQPKTSATAPATPIPAKFQNPDGTLNEDRLAKSKEAALAEYRKIEADLRKAQNQRAQIIQPAAHPAPQIQN